MFFKGHKRKSEQVGEKIPFSQIGRFSIRDSLPKLIYTFFVMSPERTTVIP